MRWAWPREMTFLRETPLPGVRRPSLVHHGASSEVAEAVAPSSPHERAAWLVGLRRIVDAAEAAFTTVLADFDAAGDGETLHAAASTQAWLRGALGMASGEASERVRMARAIRGELSAAVEALHAARLTAGDRCGDADACRVQSEDYQQATLRATTTTWLDRPSLATERVRRRSLPDIRASALDPAHPARVCLRRHETKPLAFSWVSASRWASTTYGLPDATCARSLIPTGRSSSPKKTSLVVGSRSPPCSTECTRWQGCSTPKLRGD